MEITIKFSNSNIWNSFFNSCNNLQGLSGRDNILWMIVASKSHLPYIWHTDCKVVVSHYRPRKLRTVIIHTCTWLRDSKGGIVQLNVLIIVLYKYRKALIRRSFWHDTTNIFFALTLLTSPFQWYINMIKERKKHCHDMPNISFNFDNLKIPFAMIILKQIFKKRRKKKYFIQCQNNHKIQMSFRHIYFIKAHEWIIPIDYKGISLWPIMWYKGALLQNSDSRKSHFLS